MSNNTSEFGEFSWNELMTNDPAKAKAFYQTLLGWETREINVGDMVYTLFRTGDKEIGGMLQIPATEKANIPPHWMSYIAVLDLDQTVAKAQALGASVKCPPTNVGDYGRFATIVDPTGAHIAFWQSLKNC